MSVENSPEFKKALNEAYDKQHREYLYGGGIVSSKEKIGDTLKEIRQKRLQVESDAINILLDSKKYMTMVQVEHAQEVTKLRSKRSGYTFRGE